MNKQNITSINILIYVVIPLDQATEFLQSTSNFES